MVVLSSADYFMFGELAPNADDVWGGWLGWFEDGEWSTLELVDSRILSAVVGPDGSVFAHFVERVQGDPIFFHSLRRIRSDGLVGWELELPRGVVNYNLRGDERGGVYVDVELGEAGGTEMRRYDEDGALSWAVPYEPGPYVRMTAHAGSGAETVLVHFRDYESDFELIRLDARGEERCRTRFPERGITGWGRDAFVQGDRFHLMRDDSLEIFRFLEP